MQYIEIGSTIAIYSIILTFAVYYKKRAKRPVAWWKMLFVLLVGLFSFSINFNFFGEMHKFAILPLGAVVFYFITRKKGDVWPTYKPFIWIGFLANYAFFVIGIALVPILNALYPPNNIDTYIKNVQEAAIITTHMSASEHVRLTENAQQLLLNSTNEQFNADEWYYDLRESVRYYNDEQFPYMLSNVTKPLGMNEKVLHFVEKDGQGLLIITDNVQYYFRTVEPFIQVGDADEN